jgi:hypothetical protein
MPPKRPAAEMSDTKKQLIAEVAERKEVGDATMKELQSFKESFKEENKALSCKLDKMLRFINERLPVDAKTFNLADFQEYLAKHVWPVLNPIAERTAKPLCFIR